MLHNATKLRPSLVRYWIGIASLVLRTVLLLGLVNFGELLGLIGCKPEYLDSTRMGRAIKDLYLYGGVSRTFN